MEDVDLAPGKAVLDVANGPLPDAVKALERGSLQLPIDQDFHFYSNFQEFKGPVAKLQSRVVSLLNDLGSLKQLRSHACAFPDELDEGYDWLVGVQDDLLERVDASLDRFHLERKDQYKQKSELNAFEASSKQKLAKKASPAAAAEDKMSGSVKVARSKEKATARSPIPFHIRSIPRPQDKFDDAADNSNTPFKHRAAKGKNQLESQASNAQETLQISADSSTLSTASGLEHHARDRALEVSAQNTHPLEEELTNMTYVKASMDTVEIRKYKLLDDTPFTLVTTLKALKEMAVKLRMAGEIAVDLENHHYRSYQGFVCLMQVSTRDEDFIVDTLDLRSHIGPCLGGIFSDPTIRKVMHGADHDIVWLQRDFGIYVCNLFDTGQAARVLHLQGFGLAFLLEYFCGVRADKRYQLADWRIRPLPPEMIKYAREDTHYLLYVHDMLRKELLHARADGKFDDDDPFFQVCKRSRDICLQLYAKELFTETSYQQLYGLQEKKFRPDQLAVLAALYAWRDLISRKEDESTGYVLPNHLLFQLASEMPDNIRQLQSFVKGSYTLVGSNASSIIAIIRQAKENALMGNEDRHEEDERKGVFAKNEELGGSKVRCEVSKIDHSEQIEGISTNVRSQSDGIKTEIKIFSNILQADNLVNQSEASSTLVITSSGDSHGSEATRSDNANALVQVATDAVPEVGLGVGQLNLTSDVLTRPVLVSRRTSSSFFKSRPQRIPSVPLPSSLVSTSKELVEISEVQHPSTALVGGPTVQVGSPIHNAHPAMPETFTTEEGEIKSPDERWSSDKAREGTRSEKFLTTETAVMIEECLTGSSLLPKEGAVDISSDMPFTVPEISARQVSLGQAGNGHEIHNNITLSKNSTIQAGVECEKDTENALVVQAKRKPSKLGGLLGGRSRVQHGGPGRFAKDFDPARTKAQHIESSMILPFNHPVPVTLDMTSMNPMHPATADAKVITSTSEKKMENRSDKLDGETGKPFDEGLKTTYWPEILMLDREADDTSPIGETERIVSNGTIRGTDLENRKKHRVWWPSAADSPSLVHGRHSSSSLPGPLDTTSDQLLRRPDNESSQSLLSLSEMRRMSKGGLEFRNHLEHSNDNVNPEGFAADVGSGGHVGRNKRRQREPPSSTEDGTEVKKMVSTDNRVDFRSFNYREARSRLGLDNLYNDNMEDRQGTSNRDRGNRLKKGSNKQRIPLSKSAFDPLRRAREQPRPEGIPPGPRRQVFPQSGNRTAVFKQ